MDWCNKKIIKILQITATGISLILLIVSFFIRNTPAHKSYVYKNNEIISNSWHNDYETIVAMILLFELVIFIISNIMHIICKIMKKEKIIKSMALATLLFVFNYIVIFISSVMVVGLWAEDDYDSKCYMFIHNNHTIVIEEKSFLLYGGGTIYQIQDNNEANVIGEISTDDGGRNNGKYSIKWFEDSAEITYKNFTSNNSTSSKKVYFE